MLYPGRVPGLSAGALEPLVLVYNPPAHLLQRLVTNAHVIAGSALWS